MNGSAYECTLKLFELASSILRRMDVRQVAEPFMHSLAETTLETIHLSVLDRAEVIYLHKIESPQPVRAYATIGGARRAIASPPARPTSHIRRRRASGIVPIH